MEALQQVANWIQQGESEILELKKSTSSQKQAVKTLCAMLNTRGGKVVFGVEPNGSIVGEIVSDKTIEQLSNHIREIDPPAIPSIDRIPIGDGRTVLVVSVSRGQSCPYTYKRQAFSRVGNTTVELSQAQYNEILLERLHSERRWENQPAEGWQVRDLDPEEIQRTIDESVNRGRQDDPGTRDPEAVLKGLGLIRNGRLLRAAPVLFGKQSIIEQRLPQCLLRVARFRGVDKTEFVDNRQFVGNSFRLLRSADRFLRDHLPVSGRVVPNLFERRDDPLYPPIALREALANAICHRDYSIGAGSVAIAIFDDRLEITSSGELHFGIKVEDLFRDHESLPWNPLIANVFYRRGIVERWGRGTIVMAELLLKAGLPKPEIENAGGRVTVRFRPGNFGLPAGIQQTLSKGQHELLAFVEARGEVALRHLKQALPGRPEWEIKQDLSGLKQLGLLQTRGRGRGAVWYRSK